MSAPLFLYEISSWEDVYARIHQEGYTLTNEQGKTPLMELRMMHCRLVNWVGFHPGSLTILDIRDADISSWDGFDPGIIVILTVAHCKIHNWIGFQVGNIKSLYVTANNLSDFRLMNCRSISVVRYDYNFIPYGPSDPYTIRAHHLRVLYPIHVHVITRAVLRRWVRRYRWRRACEILGWGAYSSMAMDLREELSRIT